MRFHYKLEWENYPTERVGKCTMWLNESVRLVQDWFGMEPILNKSWTNSEPILLFRWATVSFVMIHIRTYHPFTFIFGSAKPILNQKCLQGPRDMPQPCIDQEFCFFTYILPYLIQTREPTITTIFMLLRYSSELWHNVHHHFWAIWVVWIHFIKILSFLLRDNCHQAVSLTFCYCFKMQETDGPGSPKSVNRFELAQILHLLHSCSVQREMLALKILNTLKYLCM